MSPDHFELLAAVMHTVVTAAAAGVGYMQPGALALAGALAERKLPEDLMQVCVLLLGTLHQVGAEALAAERADSGETATFYGPPSLQ